MGMRGWKGFGPDWKCRDFQYEVDKEYETDQAKLCNSGFHFCEDPLDVLNHYPFIDDKARFNRFATVEGKNVSNEKSNEDTKRVASKLKIMEGFDMDSEEQVYDFMAAAEETGKQLDALVKRLPKDIAVILQQQWQQSPWRSEVPAAAASTIEAAKGAEKAAGMLWKSAKSTAWLVAVAAVIIPVASCIVAHLNLSNARKDEEAVKKRVQTLERRENSLRFATGGGAEFYHQDRMYYFVPPRSTSTCEEWSLKDGRIGIKYKLAE